MAVQTHQVVPFVVEVAAVGVVAIVAVVEKRSEVAVAAGTGDLSLVVVALFVPPINITQYTLN